MLDSARRVRNAGLKMNDADLRDLTRRVADVLLARGECLAAAESCTGGWLAKCATDMAGSSEWFERGFVVYSNAAKQSLLNVPARLLADKGAVSEAVVAAMAVAVLANSEAQHSIAISGVAGPDGGTVDKPVGLVWIAWAGVDRKPETKRFQFDGDREAVRRASVAAALEGLLARLTDE